MHTQFSSAQRIIIIIIIIIVINVSRDSSDNKRTG
jgi:hypothetical protein